MKTRMTAAVLMLAAGAAAAQTTQIDFDRYRVESGVAFELGNVGNADYLFTWTDTSGTFSSIADPTVEIAVGQTYTFQRFTGSHPFAICDDTLPVAGEDGAYDRTTFSTAVINAATLQPIADFTADPGPTTDLISWTPTAADVGTYYYTCTITGHPGMTGRIDVYDPNAEPVVHSFTAEVIEVQSFGGADFSDNFPVGLPVSGEYVINETIPDASSAVNSGDFSGAIVDFTVDFDSGAYVLTAADTADINAADNVSFNQFPAADYVQGSLPASGAPVDGLELSGASYFFGDFSNTAFPAQNPQSLSPTWDLNAFPDEGITVSWVQFGRGGDSFGGSVKIGNFTWTIETGDCPADVNGDGSVDPADFNAWIIAFNQQLPTCDQNGDGVCDPADFNAWIINFNNGC